MDALLFPGQGSQHIGMASFLYDNFKSSKLLFEEASDAAGIDFKTLLFDGPEEDLQLTENTQPALVLASTCWVLALQQTVDYGKFEFAVGHSLGEYSAMVATETIPFSDAIVAVKTRGAFMQEAVPVGKGAMAAVMGLEDDEVRALCKWAEKESKLAPIEPANFNCPGQVVISGSKLGIDWVIQNFSPEKLGWESKRAKFIPLNVSAPFHCSLMKRAQDGMTRVLTAIEFEHADFPVVQNVNAKAETDAELLKKNLIRQITAPVMWTQSIKELRKLGVTRVVEAGPGKVLSGLVKKIDREITSFNIQSLEELKAFESSF